MGNKISVVLTKDIINFVKLFKIQRFNDSSVGIDTYGLYPESHLFDFMAMVLGLLDHRVAGTEENPLGAEYDVETTKKLHELDEYIVNNIEYIEEILHQFCDVGVKPGKYSCLVYQRLWKYDGEVKQKNESN
jgi:hypothetical protein